LTSLKEVALLSLDLEEVSYVGTKPLELNGVLSGMNSDLLSLGSEEDTHSRWSVFTLAVTAVVIVFVTAALLTKSLGRAIGMAQWFGTTFSNNAGVQSADDVAESEELPTGIQDQYLLANIHDMGLFDLPDDRLGGDDRLYSTLLEDAGMEMSTSIVDSERRGTPMARQEYVVI